MDIDLGTLREGLATLATAVGIYKQIKDALPAGSKKDEADEALEKAERQLKLAESQIAQGLRYELCRNHFSPAIMLSPDDKNWKCPECDSGRCTGAASISVDLNASPNRRRRRLL